MRGVFRIEALLRSKAVQKLYIAVSNKTASAPCSPDRLKRWKSLSRHVFKRKGETASRILPMLGDDSLRNHFFIDDGWLVLWGAHHRYLRPDPFVKAAKRVPWDVSDGILDLGALAQAGKLNRNALPRGLTQKQKLLLFAQINGAYPPEAISRPSGLCC